jgi:sulfur-oxidizing protein SoxZ
MATIKIRAKAKNGVTTVKALMSHPMETGFRKDKKTGKKIPPHYITEVTGLYSGKTVISANWAGAISKNPYLSFKFKGGQSGEKIKLSWIDNKGEGDSLEATIK